MNNMARVQDLTGRRFGRLVARKHVGYTLSGNALWRCKCDCGRRHVAAADDLTAAKGGATSCGCKQIENCSRVGKAANVHQYPRTCPHCGDNFLGTARQIYCKRAHAVAARKAKERP